MNLPKVYIIILNWNGLADTLECLESVTKLAYDNFKILVVDNASSDGSVTVIHNKFPSVEIVVNDKNLGFTGGNNIGIRYALDHGTDYVWLLNNDTTVDSASLQHCVSIAESDHSIGLVSSIIRYYDEPERNQFIGSRIDLPNRSYLLAHSLEEAQRWEVENSDEFCLLGTALLVRKVLIESIGLLDERFFAYWEDIDYSIRSRVAEFKNRMAYDSMIYHKSPVPGSMVRNISPRYCYYMARNHYYLWQKMFGKGFSIKLSMFCIAEGITQAASLRDHNEPQLSDASITGLCDAVRGIEGEWDGNYRSSFFIRVLMKKHTYLWGMLLKGEFKKIAITFVEKTKSSVSFI